MVAFVLDARKGLLARESAHYGGAVVGAGGALNAVRGRPSVRSVERGWLGMRKGPHRVVGALRVMVVRRRPTLPPRLRGSTIGAERLSFRVRNETGRFPLAMAAVTS